MGGSDIFVAKIDSGGTVKWVRSYGGTKLDLGYAITATPDGGCVATGCSQSDDVDFAGLGKGDNDIVVIKLDDQGDVQWRKLLGGSLADEGRSITAVQGGGIVLAGCSRSSDADFLEMNLGSHDIVVIKLDEEGDMQWKKTYGGTRSDQAFSVCLAPDHGVILTGSTQSKNGSFEGMGKGSVDAFVLKLDAVGDLTSSTSVDEALRTSWGVVASPNPIVPGATIGYMVARPSHVCIQMIDSRGHVVATLFNGYAEAGMHLGMLCTSGLAAGRYTIRMANEDSVVYSAVIVL